MESFSILLFWKKYISKTLKNTELNVLRLYNDFRSPKAFDPMIKLTIYPLGAVSSACKLTFLRHNPPGNSGMRSVWPRGKWNHF